MGESKEYPHPQHYACGCKSHETKDLRISYGLGSEAGGEDMKLSDLDLAVADCKQHIR